MSAVGTRPAGGVATATGRGATATGRVAAATGRVATATGRVAAATGRVATATGRVAAATGRVAAVEISAEHFKNVFRNHPAGVAVITLRGPHGPVGFTATSVFSISADPPLLGFSLAGTSSSLPAVRAAGSLVVNFLAADQGDVAARFARKDVDRFAGTDWLPLPTGEPVLRGTTAWVRGHIEQRTPAGESLLVVVRAVLADRDLGSEPLVYVDRTYHRLGEHSRLV